MDLELHENAIAAFNERAQKLKELVRRYQISPNSREKIPVLDSEPFISVELSEENTTGPRFSTKERTKGHITNGSLTVDNYIFELEEEGCGLLLELSESIWRAGNTAFLVKRNYIFRAFFEWAADGENKDVIDFIGHFKRKLDFEAQICTVLIPLFHLRSSLDFDLLDCRIREVSGAEIDGWLPEDEYKDDVIRMKQIFQGHCVIEAKIYAVEDHAVDEALRLAEIISSLLAFYSLACIHPQTIFNGVPVGQEYAPKYSALVFNSSGPKPIESSGYINDEDALGYVFTEEKLNTMNEHGILDMSELFRIGKKSDFQSQLRDAVSTFARASRTKSSSEKLVFGVVSMESLFIANESEPISQNLADRLALLLGDSVEEKKTFASTVKKAYSLRSRYVHHGKSSEDNEVISEFLKLGYLALVSSLMKTNEFETKLDFLNSLDDLKYKN